MSIAWIVVARIASRYLVVREDMLIHRCVGSEPFRLLNS